MSAALDIALIQTRTPATQAAAWAELEPLVREAARGGARFILTPEASNVMEQRRERRGEVIVAEDDDAVIQGLRGLAQELGVWILIGSAIVKAEGGDGRSANRSLLVDDRGEIVARYDKLHVFDVDLPNGETYRESANVRPGERATVAATPLSECAWRQAATRSPASSAASMRETTSASVCTNISSKRR